ncbi:MAG: hypothetical protein ABIQ30_06610 [Devosia sp.]
MTSTNMTPATASGTWKAKTNQICVDWPTVAAPYYFTVTSDGGGKYHTSKGVD